MNIEQTGTHDHGSATAFRTIYTGEKSFKPTEKKIAFFYFLLNYV